MTKRLLSLDPIGIINETFIQILEHLQQTNQRLALARNEIDAIFNTVAAGVLVLDRERRILAFNNKLREIFLEGRQGRGAAQRP